MFNNLNPQDQLGQIYKRLNGNPALSRKKIKQVLEENSPYKSGLIDKLPGVVFCCLDDDKWTMLYLNKNFTKLTGYNYLDLVANYKLAYEEIIDPRDRDMVRDTIAGNLRGYEVNYRIVTREGQVKWVSEIGHRLKKFEGYNMLEGFILDITFQKQAEDELTKKNEFINSIITNMPIGIAAHDIESSKVLYANQSLAKIMGFSGSNQQFKCYLEDLGKKPEYSSIEGKIKEILAQKKEGEIAWGDISFTRPDGQKVYANLASIPLHQQNMIVTTINDTTDIIKASNKIKHLNRLYSVLSNINQAIVRNKDEQTLLGMVPDIISNYGKFPLTWIGAYDEDEGLFELVSANTGNYIKDKCRTQDKSCQIGAAMLEGKPFIVNNLQNTDSPVPCKAEVVDRGIGSAAFFPISIKGKIFGFLAVFAGETDFFKTDEVALFEEITADISFALQSYKQRKLRKKLQREIIATNNELTAIIEASPLAIFELDRQGRVKNIWNKAAEDMFGFSQEEAMGKVLPIVPASKEHQFRRLLKTALDGNSFSGVELTRKRKDGSSIDILLATAPLFDPEGQVEGVMSIILDITEKKRSIAKIAQSEKDLRKLFFQSIESMSAIVETKDPYTSGHQKRVANLAVKIAQKMGLSREQVHMIRLAAMVHDIGKIYIPPSILSKPGKLSDIEFSLIKIHPQSSYDILKNIEFPWPIAEVVLQHHERVDGSGYPKGLKGDDIMLESKILAVADVVEAMAAHRPYRPAPGLEKALEEINRNKGKLYDQLTVNITTQIIENKEIIL